MTDLEKYYSLCKNSSQKKEYERFLSELSESTTSREFFTKNNKKEVHSKRKELHINIINTYLNKHKTKKNPTFHFILGFIGSGKTSLKDKVFKNESQKDFFILWVLFS